LFAPRARGVTGGERAYEVRRRSRIGFVMKDAAQAEAWHKAGVANGGTSIEDPPGKRPNGAYLAYLRDPDGHKLVGVAR
jgi:catechol 2,3-dioxygenase-like lactoylglutathione lyase family enzyme